MAVSGDPLRREAIAVQARDTGDRYQAPRTNAALQLAGALGDLQPGVNTLVQGIGDQLKASAEAKAHRDVLISNGAKLGDAVRMGTIEATQNPWYIQAYKRESAATSSKEAFSKLQIESTQWEEVNDPAAFQKRWNEEVGLLARQYEGPDEVAGFAPVEAQTSQQVLQSNVSQNVARIKNERVANLSVLTASALTDAVRTHGGVISDVQTWDAIAPARAQWFATGGDVEGWNAILTQSVFTAARQANNPGMVDLLKSPVLLSGPEVLTRTGVTPVVVEGSTAAIQTIDPNTALQPGAQPVPSPAAGITDGGAPPEAPKPASAVSASTAIQPNRGTVSWPVVGHVTSGFGDKRGSGPRHSGIDIAVPIGTKVAAPGTATVYRVGHDAKSGNFVILDHGGGVFSSYSHLSQASVQQGQQIEPGQVIALSGNTGDVHSAHGGDGAHLHWRVRTGGPNGKSVDPRSINFSHVTGGNPAPANQGAPAPAGKGFQPQGVDKPFQYQPDNPAPIAVGPSLYDLPGVSQEAEQSKYYIGQQAEAAQTQRLHQLQLTRQARGFEAADTVWQQYGTRVLTGDFDQNTIVQDLSGKGYSGPEIAEALQQLRAATTDSAGLMNSRAAIRGADPQRARQNMDLFIEGQKGGYTPEYEEKVGQAILRGDLTGDEGNRYVDGALGTTQRNEAIERTERGEQRTILNGYNALNSQIRAASKAVVAGGVKVRGRSPRKGPEPDYDWAVKQNQRVEAEMRTAAERYLAAHPGDFPGALDAARDWGNRILNRFLASHQPHTGPAPAAGAGGSNPRR